MIESQTLVDAVVPVTTAFFKSWTCMIQLLLRQSLLQPPHDTSLTRTHTLTHKRTHTYTHSLSHTHTRIHTRHTLSLTHRYTQTHTPGSLSQTSISSLNLSSCDSLSATAVTATCAAASTQVRRLYKIKNNCLHLLHIRRQALRFHTQILRIRKRALHFL